MTETCPHCGQPMPAIRCGVRMTPLKARIFDFVAGRGIDGIPMRQLNALIWGNSTAPRHALKSHVWQINDILEDTGYRIVRCGGGGSEQSYRLYRLPLNPEELLSPRASHD